MANGQDDVVFSVGAEFDDASFNQVSSQAYAASMDMANEVATRLGQTSGLNQGVANAGYDPSLMASIAQGNQQASDSFKEVDMSAQQTTQSFGQISRAGRLASNAINILGTALTAFGGAITGGAALAVAAFIKDSQDMNQTAMDFTEAQKQMADATYKVGDTITQIELPAIKELADLAEQAAGFAQNNPDLVGGVLEIGATSLLAGILLKVVAQGVRMYADLEYLGSLNGNTAALMGNTAALGANSAINKFGGVGTAEYLPGGVAAGGFMGAVGGLGGIAAGGVGILGGVAASIAGNAALNQLGDTIQKLTGDADAAKATVDLLGQFLGGLPGFQGIEALHEGETAYKQFTNEDVPAMVQGLDELVKKFPALKGVIIDIANATGTNQPQALNQSEMGTVTKDYETMMDQINKDITNEGQQELQAKNQLASSEAKIAENTAKSIERIQANSADATLNAQENLSAQEYQTTRDANEQIAQARLDLNNKLADLEQTHDNTLWDLGEKRDALGISKEDLKYNQQENIDKHDEQQTIAKDRRDEAQKLADEQSAFDRSQEQRKRAEALQIADQYQNEADQMQAQQDSEATKLQDLKDSLSLEESTLRDSFVTQVRTLDAGLLGEANAVAEFNRNMQQQAEDLLRSLQGTKIGLGGNSAIGAIQGYRAGHAPQVTNSSNSANVVQNFYGDYSNAQQQLIQQETLKVLSKALPQ